jgi:phosphoserine phosphatase RsbU/P
MSVNEDKTILIVDDDLTIRKLLGFHLKNKKYKVLEAPGAKQAFTILDNDKVDLVLCDVTMGEMDGFTFCKKVRENQNFRAMPFIFVTAKTSLEDKSMALEAGGDDFITKPFDAQELLIKVQSLLRRSDIYKTYGAKKSLQASFTEDTPKVLLVDDEESLLKLFYYNLTKAGFDCITAIGGAEGLKKAREAVPDIIISDIMMPNIDGFELRKLLLEDEELKNIPFLFLTSKGEEADILEGYDLGITDYIIKTSGPRVVVAKVSAILNSLGKERQKVVAELHTAADSLRAKVVPDNYPRFSGYEIKHWHQPFKGIPGGDFIDYFSLDENNLAIILGDVMGKKWNAWYFAFAYAGYIRSALRSILQRTEDHSPSEIIQHVNQSIYQDAKVSEVFATLSVITVNNKTMTAKYSGAGDLPVLLKRKNGSVISYVSDGMLLGFTQDGNYNDVIIPMEQGDFLFLTTDGVLESRSLAGEQFGSKRLQDLLDSIPPEADQFEILKAEFFEFTGGRSEDDLSSIIIKAL